MRGIAAILTSTGVPDADLAKYAGYLLATIALPGVFAGGCCYTPNTPAVNRQPGSRT